MSVQTRPPHAVLQPTYPNLKDITLPPHAVVKYTDAPRPCFHPVSSLCPTPYRHQPQNIPASPIYEISCQLLRTPEPHRSPPLSSPFLSFLPSLATVQLPPAKLSCYLGRSPPHTPFFITCVVSVWELRRRLGNSFFSARQNTGLD